MFSSTKASVWQCRQCRQSHLEDWQGYKPSETSPGGHMEPFFPTERCRGVSCQRFGQSVSRWVVHDFFATPWTAARQAPPSQGFSRQEQEWLPFPSPGDPPHPGVEPASPALESGLATAAPPGGNAACDHDESRERKYQRESIFPKDAGCPRKNKFKRHRI